MEPKISHSNPNPNAIIFKALAQHYCINNTKIVPHKTFTKSLDFTFILGRIRVRKEMKLVRRMLGLFFGYKVYVLGIPNLEIGQSKPLIPRVKCLLQGGKFGPWIWLSKLPKKSTWLRSIEEQIPKPRIEQKCKAIKKICIECLTNYNEGLS